MRKLLLLLPLIIAACSGSHDGKKTPEVVTAQKQNVKFRWVEEQTLIIQSTKVHIKMAAVDVDFPEKQDWVIITTPQQSFSYLVKDSSHGHELVHNLSSEQLEMLKKAPLNYPASEIDLEISSLVEKYQVLNTLELSRCRTAPVWQELVQMVQAKRPTIYFNASFSQQTSWALKWDMDSQTFKGVVDTLYALHQSYRGEFQLLLTPNRNIYSKSELLLPDSQFVSFSTFHEACDFGYDIYEPLDVNSDFLPRYEKSKDEINSGLIKVTIQNATVSTGSALESFPPTTDNDIAYAKKLKLY